MIFKWARSHHVINIEIKWTVNGPSANNIRGLIFHGRRPDMVILTKEEMIRLSLHNDTQDFLRKVAMVGHEIDIAVAVPLNEFHQ